MYQIFYTNDYIDFRTGKEKRAFKPAPVRVFDTLEDLFLNGAEELKKNGGEGSDLRNIYYTLAHHERGHRSKQAWKLQEFIPFDLDGIDLAKIDEYAPLACEALGLSYDDATVVYSGNGIQIIFKVDPFADIDFITNNKSNWLRAYDKICKAFTDKSLPITRDTTAWDYARIFRLPNTINHKLKKNSEGKLEDVIKNCTLVKISSNVVPLPFDYAAGEDVVNNALPIGSFGNPDEETILKGCDFFKWLRNEPNEVHEPHAYAMLSITGHFKEDKIGRELYSKFSSPSINAKTFEEFSEQALRASGPRTCDGINSIWGKCETCPNFKKVISPIQLKSSTHIGSDTMGFTTRAGKTITRQYRELALYMSQELNFKSCSTQGVIYIFNGTHYEIYNDLSIKAYAEKHFSQPVKERERQEFLCNVRVTNIIDGEDEKDFINGKNTEGFINFRNGILNLDTGSLYPHGANFHFHYCLPYDFNPNAVAPNFERFLDQITLGREELKSILLEYMGYILYGGEYVYQKALILSGSGKNGKSTYVNVLKEICGSGNYNTVPLATLASNNFFLPEIQNKLVNISEEEPVSCFKDTGLFKNLTGNNSVSANRKFEKPYSFVSKAKIVITYNEMPYIADTSVGMRRRLMVCPFDLDLEGSPEKVDIKIMDKLRGELSGIFNMALEAYHGLVERGAFTKSIAVEESVADLFDFNIFDLWYEESVAKSDDLEDFITCKDIYESYLEYANGIAENGKYYGLKKFGLELKKKGFKSSVLFTKDRKSLRVYKGVRLAVIGKVSAKF